MKCFYLLLLFCSATFGFHRTVYADTNQPIVTKDPLIVDRIVAVVGEAVITLADLEQRVQEILADTSQKDKHALPRDVLKSQLLEEMMTEESLLQYAKKTGIKVDAADVQAVLNKTTPLSKDKKGISPAESRRRYDKEWRRQMISYLFRRDVAGRIVVSDNDVEQAMKSSDMAALGNDYWLEEIEIVIPQPFDNETLPALKIRLDKVLGAIKSSQHAQDALASIKTDGFSLKIDDRGWQHAYLLNPQLVTLLSTLKSGDITHLIRSKEGFVVFKLLDKRPTGESEKVNKQYHVAHILIKVGPQKSEQAALQEIQSIADRIAKGSDFKEAAQRYSEDTSKTRDGDIGWVALGKTVPTFEAAMLKLPLNTVSKPVRTIFGWHLIKVFDIRQEDYIKNAVRERLFQQNLEQVFQDWQQQIRDATHIEKRL